MSINDLELLSPENKDEGIIRYAVAASATIIYPGEPVIQSLGDYVVSKMATNSPTAGTDYVAGVAMSTSTNTALLAGTVDVLPINPTLVWLANPYAPTSWDTQAEYDLLIGDRVLLNLSAGGVFTILATDGTDYGCVIQPLDVKSHPGKIAFSFKNQVCGVQNQKT